MEIDVLKYISENVIILIPFLYFIGMFLKNTEKVSDKWIPLILLAISIMSCIYFLGFKFNAIIQGVLVAGTTVYFNQIIKQVKKVE